MAYARHVTLTATVVTTFTVTDNSSGFEILNRNGLGEIYISFDGTASPANPTVGGNDCDVVPAAVGAGLRVRRTGAVPVTVKVISAQATAVSFRGIL
jgi:hypothetical protein